MASKVLLNVPHWLPSGVGVGVASPAVGVVASQPSSRANVPLTRSLIPMVPLLVPAAEHEDVSAVPRAMFTIMISSLMVTVPLPSQSPTHATACAARGGTSHTTADAASAAAIVRDRVRFWLFIMTPPLTGAPPAVTWLSAPCPARSCPSPGAYALSCRERCRLHVQLPEALQK